MGLPVAKCLVRNTATDSKLLKFVCIMFSTRHYVLRFCNNRQVLQINTFDFKNKNNNYIYVVTLQGYSIPTYFKILLGLWQDFHIGTK